MLMVNKLITKQAGNGLGTDSGEEDSRYFFVPNKQRGHGDNSQERKV